MALYQTEIVNQDCKN